MTPANTTLDLRARLPAGGTAIAAHVAATSMIALAVLLIWGTTGAGYFWPMWVWLGVGIPLALHAAVRWASARRPGAPRQLAMHGAISAVLGGMEIVVW